MTYILLCDGKSGIVPTPQGVNSLVVFDQPAGDRQSYKTSSKTTVSETVLVIVIYNTNINA